MRKLSAAFAFASIATSVCAMEGITEEQVEGVQKAIKAMDCTVEDMAIEIEKSGHEADDVILQGRPVRRRSRQGVQGDQQGQRGLGHQESRPRRLSLKRCRGFLASAPPVQVVDRGGGSSYGPGKSYGAVR